MERLAHREIKIEKVMIQLHQAAPDINDEYDSF